MKQGMNKAILIGNLGADAELKHTQSGQAVMRLRLATTERWRSKEGTPQERTEWHTVTMWGPRAEGLARHLTKGTSVYIEGRISTREWQDKDGGKRWSTEIVATELLFLGGGGGQSSGERSTHSGQQHDSYGSGSSGGFGDDDIPFDRIRGEW